MLKRKCACKKKKGGEINIAVPSSNITYDEYVSLKNQLRGPFTHDMKTHDKRQEMKRKILQYELNNNIKTSFKL